ncbi:MAG: exodeoxyribonuclease VII large subunit [Prevotella sp.]|nr:exodeoxyribonuclease VII large subunit [Prevotella sp.]
MQRKALTLYELNSLVRDVIETTLDGAYWVEAELSEAREVHGHCYMELVQKDLFGATPVARASAKCWRNTWIRLKPKFERTTGQSLHAGMKVMLLVTANFHEAYGFSWIVQDIDPTYTMGDMARKRLEIINQLKAEGVFDMQKGLELPMFAQHIAVISSEGAAGYGDFCHQLKENDEGFWFYTELFPAVMQGADVEPTVIAALDAINDRLDEFDVVVIIRGGGATADMSGFDTLSLAENVANFPIPVITGIGHDRDESVLDMVSHTRVKTPTAAAAFLVDHLEDVWLHINDCQTRLLNVVNRRMDLAKERLSRLAERIPTLFSLVKVQQTNRVDRLSNRLSTLMHEQLMHEQYRVQALERVMQPLAQQRLTTERHRLEQLGIRLHSVDPALMLKRGYSITRINGKAVRDASQLKTGDEIETQLEKGTVKSKVV